LSAASISADHSVQYALQPAPTFTVARKPSASVGADQVPSFAILLNRLSASIGLAAAILMAFQEHPATIDGTVQRLQSNLRDQHS
jgi:hypothetical protein